MNYYVKGIVVSDGVINGDIYIYCNLKSLVFKRQIIAVILLFFLQDLTVGDTITKYCILKNRATFVITFSTKPP